MWAAANPVDGQRDFAAHRTDTGRGPRKRFPAPRAPPPHSLRMLTAVPAKPVTGRSPGFSLRCSTMPKAFERIGAGAALRRCPTVPDALPASVPADPRR
jgi:hypothetical protein